MGYLDVSYMLTLCVNWFYKPNDLSERAVWGTRGPRPLVKKRPNGIYVYLQSPNISS